MNFSVLLCAKPMGLLTVRRLRETKNYRCKASSERFIAKTNRAEHIDVDYCEECALRYYEKETALRVLVLGRRLSAGGFNSMKLISKRHSALDTSETTSLAVVVEGACVEVASQSEWRENPLDGVVRKGSSEVAEAILTGELVPITNSCGERYFQTYCSKSGTAAKH